MHVTEIGVSYCAIGVSFVEAVLVKDGCNRGEEVGLGEWGEKRIAAPPPG